MADDTDTEIKKLWGEMDMYRKVIHYQTAQIATLMNNLCMLWAHVGLAEKEAYFRQMQNDVMRLHDKRIEDLRASNPAYADLVDIRDALDGQERYKSFFPEDSGPGNLGQ